MILKLLNKNQLKIDDFVFKCSIGLNGLSSNKKEGDLKTPKGLFGIGNLYYRKDRIKNISSNLNSKIITKKLLWCHDLSSKKFYNKLVYKNKKLKGESLYRKDHKYDLLIPIKYNTYKRIVGKGSCIFLHITNNYKPTAGCIAIKKKDFLILVKIIKKNSKIDIN